MNNLEKLAIEHGVLPSIESIGNYASQHYLAEAEGKEDE